MAQLQGELSLGKRLVVDRSHGLADLGNIGTYSGADVSPGLFAVQVAGLPIQCYACLLNGVLFVVLLVCLTFVC